MKSFLIASLTLFVAVLASAEPPSPEDPLQRGCTGAYRKQIRRTEIAIGLGPLVGSAGLVGSGMLALGWEYGGWTSLKATLGPSLTSVAGGAINFVLPTGIAIGTLTYEGIMIHRLIRYIHAHNLVLGLYQDGENKQLDRLMRRVHQKGSPLSREEVSARLIEADQAGKLCDGSISRRKVATLKDMENLVLSFSIFPGALN